MKKTKRERERNRKNLIFIKSIKRPERFGHRCNIKGRWVWPSPGRDPSASVIYNNLANYGPGLQGILDMYELICQWNARSPAHNSHGLPVQCPLLLSLSLTSIVLSHSYSRLLHMLLCSPHSRLEHSNLRFGAGASSAAAKGHARDPSGTESSRSNPKGESLTHCQSKRTWNVKCVFAVFSRTKSERIFYYTVPGKIWSAELVWEHQTSS